MAAAVLKGQQKNQTTKRRYTITITNEMGFEVDKDLRPGVSKKSTEERSTSCLRSMTPLLTLMSPP